MKTKFNGILTLLLAFVVQITFAQEKTISGTVSESSGTLPGVSVVVKGTNQGTETDFDGKYSIKANNGAVLVFRYLGYSAVEKTVGASNTINVTLSVDEDNVLDEVIVIGYGTTTKKAFAGTATTVSAENLEAKSFSNVTGALIGEVAGVTIINSSGQPGSVGTVRIRGYGSVNGNRNPLYVVDGVPYTGSINSINPSDIASTTILKDASATAIYGSRGANGVIVITTKTGSTSKSYIEVDVKTSINDQLIPRYNVVKSPEEYIGYVWEGIKNKAVVDGRPDPVGFANANLFTNNYVATGYNMWNVSNGAELIDPATGMVRPGITRKYTPQRFADLSFSAAIRTEANLRMSGGAGDTRYFASFGYLEDNGYSINTGYKRYTTRLNLNTKVKPWLKLNSNINYAYSESIANGQTNGSENITEFADKMAPIFPVFLRDDNGELVPDDFYGGNQYDYGSTSGFRDRPNANGLNPIGSAKYDFNGTDRHEFNGNFRANIDLFKNVTAEISYGVQYLNQVNRDYTNKFYGTGQTTQGSIYVTDFSRLSENIQQIVRYSNSWGAHSLDLLAAHESQASTDAGGSAGKALQVSAFLLDLDNFQESLGQASGYSGGYTLESYFSKIDYNYDGKYYFSGSIRHDGSSRFANEKWGTFGSVAASWVLSEEKFLQDVDFIKFLKLKTSWGITGDQAGVGLTSGFDTFNVGNLAGNISIAPGGNGNPDLTWEQTYKFQTGLDFDLGFLSGELIYYNDETVDQFFNRNVGPSQGINAILVNDGTLANRGFEFDLRTKLIDKKDYSLSLNANAEIMQNVLTVMPIDPATGKEQVLNGNLSVGRSIFDLYMREWAGVDPSDGAPMWYQYYDDVNNNGVFDADEPTSGANSWIPADADVTNASGSIVEYQQVVPGANIKKRVTKSYSEASEVYLDKSGIADIRGAFRLTGRVKDFTFSTQFTYSLGGYAYDNQYGELMSDRFGAVGNNYSSDIVNRWTTPGQITDVPRLADGADQNATSQSSRFVTSTDHLALNNVNVSYNVPSTFLEGKGLDTFNIWMSADNLFMNTARRGFLPTTSESGSSGRRLYAPMTTITLGVRLKF